ncbi:MAG TPA: amino acid ABC transporter permease [Acidimicrobiales bacterium]|nr:amino acid ABC transporter permease [Acidimicrobiales bacterium]
MIRLLRGRPTAVPLLGDALGPRGKRRVRVASFVAGVAVAAIVGWMIKGLMDAGQFAGRLWEPFTDSNVLDFLWVGLLNTAKAAALAMVLAMVLGALLALARLTDNRLVRWPAVAFIEFFRGIPLILLIFFIAIGLPKYGLGLPPLWALVLGLVAYNGAVLAEIFRAGILSLDRGQSEAAFAIGLGYWPAMRLVIIPQAARRMVPAIVSQLVTLLKDTSLGFVIPYEELLRRSDQTGKYYGNILQALVVAALIYIAVNYCLSHVAKRLEHRQRRRLGASGIRVAGAAEDLAVLSAQAQNHNT